MTSSEQSAPEPERPARDTGPVDATTLDAAAQVVVASRALLGVIARSLAGALEQVTLPQFRILVVLSSRGPLRAGLLAEEIGTSPSTLTRAVDRLVRGGWVTRRVSAESRRETHVFPTDKALALVHDVTTRRAAEIAAVLADIAPEERATVQRGLALFAAAAGEPPVVDLLALGLVADV